MLVIFITTLLSGSCPIFTLNSSGECQVHFSVFIFNMLPIYNFDSNPVDCLALVLGEKDSYLAVFISGNNGAVY